MKITRRIIFILLFVFGGFQLHAQKMFGIYAGNNMPLVSNNEFGLEYGKSFAFGATVWKWRDDAMARKFRITNFGYRTYELKNSSLYIHNSNFVSGNLNLFTYEIGGGRAMGNYEMDDSFFPYFYFSMLAGLGTENSILRDSGNELYEHVATSFSLEYFNWSFGLNKALGTRAVACAEIKFQTGIGAIPTFQASLQGRMLFKLY